VPDEKISEMADIGTMTGTEKLPLVRTPTDGNNYSVAVSALLAFAGGLAPQLIDTRTTSQTYTLPTGTTLISPLVIDQYGNARNNPITINGAAFPLSINQNYGAIPFIWAGGAWYPF